MGGGYSCDTSVPPGGALLYVQKPECFAQPSFSETKPACISTVPDSTWQPFQSKVAAAASSMWSERAMLMGVTFLPFAFVLFLFPIQGLPIFVNAGVAIAFFGFLLGPRFLLVNKNEAQDAIIQGACSDFASATGLSVTYRTQYTGVCKPKHAKPLRAIAIAPMTPMGGAPMQVMGVVPGNQLMNVQVPSGASPGTALQVQTPSGQLVQVVVPTGVSEGQTFQVQVPAGQV